MKRAEKYVLTAVSVCAAAALVIGNYGLWNAYALVTAIYHAPTPGQLCGLLGLKFIFFLCVCVCVSPAVKEDSTTAYAKKLLTKPSD